jgi:hypothetical protein
MPMQDKSFLDGTSKITLVKYVFAFVGGTFDNMEGFSKWASMNGGQALKGPDFHSRFQSGPPGSCAGRISG